MAQLMDRTSVLRHAQRRKRAGRGLLARLLAITVLPVLAVGLFVALLLGVERVHALRAIDDSLASTVARILATTLDVSDLSQVATQLQAAVGADNVAFVDVRPAEGGLRFFRSKTPETDWALRAAYDAAVQNAPGDHRFVFPGTRPQLYRQAAAQVADPAVRERLRAVADSLPIKEQVYQVVRASVYQDSAGRRALRLPGEAAPPGQPIFELGVGVNNAQIEALLSRQQGLVIGACTLAALLAAGLAWRATRRIVRPIVQLTRAADRLSLGELEGPVLLELPGRAVNELNELAQAIERLRTSLALAMNRLRPQALPGQGGLPGHAAIRPPDQSPERRDP
ncbi:HAMP domain-containing protein [Deinococcus radiomollis]|uniref:HAMP domain-containing protein n=1 Tax=Deinococcus radiomollis TaxID=468916 RepID=UPI003891E32D